MHCVIVGHSKLKRLRHKEGIPLSILLEVWFIALKTEMLMKEQRKVCFDWTLSEMEVLFSETIKFQLNFTWHY